MNSISNLTMSALSGTALSVLTTIRPGVRVLPAERRILR